MEIGPLSVAVVDDMDSIDSILAFFNELFILLRLFMLFMLFILFRLLLIGIVTVPLPSSLSLDTNRSNLTGVFLPSLFKLLVVEAFLPNFTKFALDPLLPLSLCIRKP